MTKRSDFDGLMNAVCVGYGYCGSLQDEGYVHVFDFFPERGKVTVDQFIDWLFLAEGDDAPSSISMMRVREKIRACFIGYMGCDAVNAKELHNLLSSSRAYAVKERQVRRRGRARA